jgi:two-component system chemotaxis response regulator CheB
LQNYAKYTINNVEHFTKKHKVYLKDIKMSDIKVIAIAASTGGVAALEKVFSLLPEWLPPIVLVLHMQPGIANIFAKQVDSTTRLSAKAATTGDFLQKGRVLVAPSGMHMRVVKKDGKHAVECKPGEKVQFVIPSADVLFDTVAKEFGRNALGVVLTGIGADGAEGLLKMRKLGARTIGQDEKTSTVYGMPKVAYEKGAVEAQLPLNQIANKIISICR